MFVSKLLKECVNYGIAILLAILGWMFIIPFICLIPKNKQQIAVIGRNGGKFLDNTKYFYLQVLERNEQSVTCTFITEDKNVYNLLNSENLPVLHYPSLKAYIYCIRSNIIVVDSFDWPKKLRLFLTFGSKRIQLWHGVGFKRIELDKLRNEVSSKKIISSTCFIKIRTCLRNITGRNINYSLVNTTSKFYLEKVFRNAFDSDHFSVYGYPRNSYSENKNNLINVDTKIFGYLPIWIKKKTRIILVTPTFRESRVTPMGLNSFNLNAIEKWCDENNVIFIFKFHPWEQGSSEIKGRNIFQYDKDADLYPLFPFIAAMVSDYSSIFMDFLLFNKPIYFLVPDIKEYIARDRQIQFDFYSMTPGVKVGSWVELLDVLLKNDMDEVERFKLMEKAFDGIDQSGSTTELLNYFIQQKWLVLSKASV